MGLSAHHRQRYARHLLLSQVGEAGQERLLSAVVEVRGDADEGTLEVARSYLERAGVLVTGPGAGPLPSPERGLTLGELELPDLDQVQRVAGCRELEEAARALLGALGALTAIQRALDLPEPDAGSGSRAAPRATLSQSFAISSEDA